MKQSLDERLQQYAELIERYHRTLDLMSERAVEGLDPMIAESRVYGRTIAGLSPTPLSIVDLGSGVGLPGIPVALTLPHHRVTLVERRRRRAAFLQIAVSQLGLENASVVQGDLRSIAQPCADIVMAQAVGTFSEVFEVSKHLHRSEVWLVSRKGPEWRSELAQLENELGSEPLDLREEVLSPHGRLVAILLQGGSACPPSG